MLIPRYYFFNDYADLYDYFVSHPHKEKSFRKNEYLWGLGEPIQRVYYIKSGICQTLATHEDGYQKILFFHSKGTVFPGFHESFFKIEKSIVTKAISDMETMEFSRESVYQMFQENRHLSNIAFESYAKLINLLIYETAHQDYNNSFIKLCNLLYLFSKNPLNGHSNHIALSQENISEILAINRVNAAKCLSRLRDEGIIVTHRKWIEIINANALKDYCSNETISET